MSENAGKTKAIVTTSVKAYHKLMDEFIAMANVFVRRQLSSLWEMGRKIDDLLSQPERYGAHTMENFVSDLNAHGVSVQADTLYQARRIYIRLKDPAMLAKAQEAGVTYKQLQALTVTAVSDEDLSATLDDVKNAKKTSKSVDAVAMLRDRQAKHTVDKASRGPSKPKTVPDNDPHVLRALRSIRNMESMIFSLTERLKEIGSCASIVCKTDNATKIAAAREHLTAAVDAFTAMSATWDSQVQKANAEFERVAPGKK